MKSANISKRDLFSRMKVGRVTLVRSMPSLSCEIMCMITLCWFWSSRLSSELPRRKEFSSSSLSSESLFIGPTNKLPNENQLKIKKNIVKLALLSSELPRRKEFSSSSLSSESLLTGPTNKLTNENQLNKDEKPHKICSKFFKIEFSSLSLSSELLFTGPTNKLTNENQLNKDEKPHKIRS